MFLISSIGRCLWFKMRRRSPFYIQFIVVLFICVFLYDKMVLERRHFRSKKMVIQTDLLDYNEDELRHGWPFQITKHYHMNDLRTYTSKMKIISKFDFPGERGERKQSCYLEIRSTSTVTSKRYFHFLGAPVVLPPVLQSLADVSFSEYRINIVASDKVAPNRTLPDLRDSKCLDIRYPRLLPSASVIMVVHNEAWSVLLRAIWSVINRSPDELLEELILVDDFSDKEHMKEKLAEFLPTVSSKIKLVRTEKREGLIRARVIGAEKAHGQVLIFLDANTESNDGWMEPLLSRIASDRSVVAIPHVDNINFTNMAYEEFNEGLMYGIGWNMYYREYPIPEREMIRNNGDVTAPYRTPALIGCAIAIDREFFFEIGTFDMEMSIWGGENTELSLRVWQCGGALEIIPCSRVGHQFRTLPYSFNGDKIAVRIRNTMRTASVWMDEYKPYFDVIIPPELRNMDVGDLSKRIALRAQLRCKGFHWYLKNVFPESVMIAGYQIQLFGTKFCLDKNGRKINRQIGIHGCHGNGYTQGFSYQKNHQIVFHQNECLSLAKTENITIPSEAKLLNDPNLLTRGVNTTNHVVLLQCNATSGEKWTYNENIHQIKHLDTGLCLSTDTWNAIAAPCNLDDNKQKWIISSFEEYSRKLLDNFNPIDPNNP
ncbi:polypeptide N-acetylgalactosaminyltransferase 1-like isoform X2 [Sitodiplosis mosellana]|uniref:polypeptide N-acetylgalactosaminyltransferase 1-like isoform X2 n=1 Tax=Sitodiplosis mosellana TaxID=263140 RepID=UPI0024437D2C|nr:polypeptide N-acetylgalactosaminyltransferase 1-like isoform X2 [Sitodiplosis mosellana]